MESQYDFICISLTAGSVELSFFLYLLAIHISFETIWFSTNLLFQTLLALLQPSSLIELTHC